MNFNLSLICVNQPSVTMRNYSVKSAAKLYLRDNDQLLNYKYSPEYRKEKAHKIRIQINNPNLLKAIELAKKKTNSSLKDHNPAQTTKVIYSQNKHKWSSAGLAHNQIQEKRLSTQKSKFQQKHSSRMKSEQIKMNRSLNKKFKMAQKRKTLQQIQFQSKQKGREEELKLRRTASERSFISQTHKESIEMLKKSKKINSKQQIKFCRERYLQAKKNHQFQIMKQKITKVQQKEKSSYKTTFLKNQMLIERKPTNPVATLTIASLANTSIKLNILPKINQVHKKKSFKTQKLLSEKKESKLLDEKKQTPKILVNPQNEQGQFEIMVTKSVQVQTGLYQKTKDQLQNQKIIEGSPQNHGNSIRPI